MLISELSVATKERLHNKDDANGCISKNDPEWQGGTRETVLVAECSDNQVHSQSGLSMVMACMAKDRLVQASLW